MHPKLRIQRSNGADLFDMQPVLSFILWRVDPTQRCHWSKGNVTTLMHQTCKRCPACGRMSGNPWACRQHILGPVQPITLRRQRSTNQRLKLGAIRAKGSGYKLRRGIPTADMAKAKKGSHPKPHTHNGKIFAVLGTGSQAVATITPVTPEVGVG
ncbi:hypothetical protein [Roseinatronobacter monicus]|uniref:hypothetical protein n=1 Tax=Roseinatronobacter monicus TaxID=393481 RepID=UPI001476B2C9|nr:hypothetical protein [Roseinatronobacter monicus]